MNTLNYAFFADDHIGYRAGGRNDPRGINLREADGYRALGEKVSSIIECEERIDGVIHGGDFFHTSHPSIRAIATVQHYLREFHKAGIPFYGVAGNHDASDNRSTLPSVAAVDDRDKNIFALYKPYDRIEIADNVLLHAVAHHGLSGDMAPIVEPDPQSLNLFVTHGAALDPKNATLLRCQDSPREQIVPPEMVLDENFIIRLLGHYHSRYAVGGEALNTWYAGSSLRRGFSDEPGRRGWLLVRIHPDGKVEVEPHDIFQRPQYDLEIIDAAGLNGNEVQELIKIHLEGTRRDEIGAQFDEINAPIIRQRVVNASRSIREGINKTEVDRLASHAMMWQLEYVRPAAVTSVLSPDATPEENTPDAHESTSILSTFSKDIVGQFDTWSEQDTKSLKSLSDKMRSEVIAGVQEHLRIVSNADVDN